VPLTGTGWDPGLRADADQHPKIFETLRGLSSRIIRADQIAGLVQRPDLRPKRRSPTMSA
jgi:hypothetical protein